MATTGYGQIGAVEELSEGRPIIVNYKKGVSIFDKTPFLPLDSIIALPVQEGYMFICGSKTTRMQLSSFLVNISYPCCP